MIWWNSIINKFIYHKDKLDPETSLKASFFIGSSFVFFLLCLLSIPYFLILIPEEVEKNPEMFYANFFGAFFTLALLFVYRRFGGRIIIVNLITLFGYGGNPGTYQLNGGIYSPDCIWGIIISAWVFLVANRLSGFIWMGISMATLVFFYYAELNGYRDFFGDLAHLKSDYFFYNYFLAGIFLLIIISLYESSKRKFVTDLKISKSEIETQKKELEAQREDIISSINYAQKIQYAVLPNEDSIYRAIPLSFILYKPRDIVSGDFFWFHEIDRDNYIIVCADCTGHGVPGAFMTVIGSNLLTQIVKENKITKPSEILAELDLKITETLKQEKTRTAYVQDGMDMSLLKVNKADCEFVYTSAKRPAIFIRDAEIREFKGSKLSVGGMRSGEKKFEEIKMNYKEDDIIYLFTDGYIDQFGGSDNKKFMIKRFRELLLKIWNLPMAEQKQNLENTISKWIGKNEQTDDIQVIGIRF